jgi:hypothetical protein
MVVVAWSWVAGGSAGDIRGINILSSQGKVI